jgi:hypothetical protein
MARAARLRVLLHSRRSTLARRLTSIMDSTGDIAAHRFGLSEFVQGHAGLALVTFVSKHGGCGDDLIETRLDEDLLACWCPHCDEMRTFGATALSA